MRTALTQSAGARALLTLVLLAVSVLLTRTASADTLLGIEFDTGTLYTINPATAAVTKLGSTGIAGMADIQFSPNGTLYGFSTSLQAVPSLYTINPQTAVATDVGALGIGLISEGGLAFGPDGTAYAVNNVLSATGVRQLFTINLSTGIATVVASLGIYDFNGLAYRNDGMLVGIDSLSNSIDTIDPVKGVVTSLAVLPFALGSVGGLTTLDGTSYLATAGSLVGQGSDSLYTVNLFTGATSLVGSFSPTFFDVGLSGIAGEPSSTPVPEPRGLPLLAVALPLLTLVLRRATSTIRRTDSHRNP